MATTTTTFLPSDPIFGGQPQGAYNPSTGQLRLPPGAYNSHLNFGSYQHFYLNQPFHPWEVALTVVAAAVMVVVVVIFVRRLRRA